MERVRQLAEAFLLAKPFRNKEPNHHLIADFSELQHLPGNTESTKFAARSLKLGAAKPNRAHSKS
jgi:hypothetical protein